VQVPQTGALRRPGSHRDEGRPGSGRPGYLWLRAPRRTGLCSPRGPPSTVCSAKRGDPCGCRPTCWRPSLPKRRDVRSVAEGMRPVRPGAVFELRAEEQGPKGVLTEADLEIKPSVYGWTVQTIALVERFLKVNIKLHHAKGQLEEGTSSSSSLRPFRDVHPPIPDTRETGAFIDRWRRRSSSVRGTRFPATS